jgi:hydrogenase maturation protease
MKSILIAGVGNCLLKDDGVGVHAARMLAKDPPPDTAVLEVGIDFSKAVSLLSNYERVYILDAMEAGKGLGTLYVCRGADLERGDTVSPLHHFNLHAVLSRLHRLSKPQVFVVGIQPGRIGCGKTLSPELAELLPSVVANVRRLVSGPEPVAPMDPEVPFLAISV